MCDLNKILDKIKINIEYGQYIPLSKTESEIIKEYYLQQLNIPIENNIINIYSNNILIAIGYERVVIGDYGAYIEISPEQIIRENIKIKAGQEFRLDSEYKVKYLWYEPIDKSDVKIYYQKRKVKYADYKRGYFYISPNEVRMVTEDKKI